jgi:dolichol kinase
VRTIDIALKILQPSVWILIILSLIFKIYYVEVNIKGEIQLTLLKLVRMFVARFILPCLTQKKQLTYVSFLLDKKVMRTGG